MPAKSATGKSTQVNSQSIGSKKSGTAPSNVKLSSQSSGGSYIKKSDGAEPAEIVALADFNRAYDDRLLTKYGLYLKALETTHSVSTDDVKYIIEKALANDKTGSWKALLDAVNADISNADDLINDIVKIDEAIEKAIDSFDIVRVGDAELQKQAEDYLSSRLKSYERPANSRKLDIDSILPASSEGKLASETYATSKLRVEAFRSLVNKIKLIFAESGQGLIDTISYKNFKDLNPPDRLDGPEGMWDAIGSYDISTIFEVLSKIFAISSGVQVVKNNQLGTKLNFQTSNTTSMFSGLLFSPYKGVAPYSSVIALTLFQYLDSNKNYVIVPEIDDPGDKSWTPAPVSFVKNSILSGDYNFADFSKYLDSYNEAFNDLESYANTMFGIVSTESSLSQAEVARIIFKSFSDGLTCAISDETSKYQLLYTSQCNNSNQLMQQFVRALSKIQYYISFTDFDDGEDSKKKRSRNKRTADKKYESNPVTDKNESMTTDSEDQSSEPKRIIERFASSSLQRDDLAVMMLALINKNCTKDPNADLRKKINDLKNSRDEINKKIENYNSVYHTTGTTDPLIAALNVEIDILDVYIKKLHKKLKKLESDQDKIKENTFGTALADSMKTTTGTFWSSAVSAYNELIKRSTKILPADSKIVDDIGVTNYGSVDEFGILTLIAKCYAHMSSKLGIEIYVDDNDKGTKNIEIIRKLNNKGVLTQDERDAFYEGKKILNIDHSDIIGLYSSNLLDFTSDTKTIDDLNIFIGTLLEEYYFDYEKIIKATEAQQNSFALLSAYGNVMTQSRDNLKSTFIDIFQTPDRKTLLDNVDGRLMIYNLTKQQSIVKRAMLDKYRPDSANGYLPLRLTYSLEESVAINEMLKHSSFSNVKSENLRIVAAGMPVHTISSIKNIDQDVGSQRYTDLVELALFKRDHELNEIIFKEKIMLFDPALFIDPSSFEGYSLKKKTSSGDIGLQIGKRIKFNLYNRDGVQSLTYDKLVLNQRYISLSSEMRDQLISNTVISYLLESYFYRTTGMIYDEMISSALPDFYVSQAARTALTNLAGSTIQNLQLPSPQTITSIIDDQGSLNLDAPVDTGDIELIANLSQSVLMKQQKQVDIITKESKFDRVFLVAIDPDSFFVDVNETTSVNGDLGLAMMWAVSRQGMLITKNGETSITPRDPISGGYSIGDITCQFLPHTANSDSGSMLKAARLSSTTNSRQSGLTTDAAKAASETGTAAKSQRGTNILNRATS
jgi:hypothetical protein